MYTEDDRNKRIKYKNNTRSTYKTQYQYNDYEDYYKDYYDNNIDTNNGYDYNYPLNDSKQRSINRKTSTNRLDVYEDDNYSYSPNDIKKKKYIVIIIILVIILTSLVIILFKNLKINSLPTGNNNNYVHLSENIVNLKIGDSKKLAFSLSGTDSNARVEWFSNDDSIVIVSTSGEIKAIGEGEAIVLVAYYLDNKVFDDECRIYVSK